MKRSILSSTIVSWLPFAVVITGLSGLVYISSQQLLRQSANDPQIQMAEDIQYAMNSQKPLPSFVSTDTIDISKSLVPFVVIYDAKEQPFISTGMLNDSIPQLPGGVFDYVKAHGEERFTWQPAYGVRVAAVVSSYSNPKTSGFVLAGRSLLEVERQEDQILFLTFGGWIVTIAISFLTVFLLKLVYN